MASWTYSRAVALGDPGSSGTVIDLMDVEDIGADSAAFRRPAGSDTSAIACIDDVRSRDRSLTMDFEDIVELGAGWRISTAYMEHIAYSSIA